MKRILGVCLLSVLCFVMVSCQKANQKPIDVIYIHHYANEKEGPEYKVDLKHKEFWKYTLEDNEKYSPRDAMAKDEGYTFVCSLNDDKIDTFVLESSMYGFARWKKSYKNHFILDGHQWGVTILFSDSTKKEITGSNKYPSSWDSMNMAFESLTGEKILQYEVD